MKKKTNFPSWIINFFSSSCFFFFCFFLIVYAWFVYFYGTLYGRLSYFFTPFVNFDWLVFYRVLNIQQIPSSSLNIPFRSRVFRNREREFERDVIWPRWTKVVKFPDAFYPIWGMIYRLKKKFIHLEKKSEWKKKEIAITQELKKRA